MEILLGKKQKTLSIYLLLVDFDNLRTLLSFFSLSLQKNKIL